jgi:hypothetical protein
MVAIFSYSAWTCYKWRIHGIFILETTILVGFQCIKRSTCEKLHLWIILGVLFLILYSHLTVYTFH